MKDWFTVIVPAVDGKEYEIEPEKLKQISEEGDIDIATLKQAFFGSGFDFILKTDDYSKIDKLVSVFKKHGIPCLPVSFSDLKVSVQVLNVSKMNFSDGKIVIQSGNENFEITPDNALVLIADGKSSEIRGIKKAVISSKRLALVTEDRAFIVDPEVAAILPLSGERNISRKANLINILEKFNEKRKVEISNVFYYKRGFFRDNLALAASFTCHILKNDFYYAQLPDSLVKKIEFKPVEDFNYRIYRNTFELMKKLYKINFTDKIVYPPMGLVTISLILTISGFRVNSNFLVSAGFFILWITLSWKLFQSWKIKHLIADTPTSKLRSAAAGFVEIKGRIYSPQPKVSPVSGAPCVFFRYRKEKYVTRGQRSGWELIEIGEGMSDYCVLRDETGEIGINLKNAKFFVTTAYTTHHTYKDMLYGIALSPFSSNVRYREEALQQGQSVYVLGTAKPLPKSISFGKFLSEVKKDKSKMKKFDLNGDGNIDTEEWEKALPQLHREYLAYKQIKGQASDLIVDLDKRNGIFIVSNEKEETLLKRINLVIPFYLAGSIVFLSLFLWSLTK